MKIKKIKKITTLLMTVMTGIREIKREIKMVSKREILEIVYFLVAGTGLGLYFLFSVNGGKYIALVGIILYIFHTRSRVRHRV